MTWRSLTLLTLALAFGCDKNDTDDQSSDDGSSETSAATDDASATETGTGGDEQLDCEDAIGEFAAFIAANNSCASDDDCVGLSAICYPNTTCGEVALNEDHDADARTEAYDRITAACDDDQCGADPCGAVVSCVDSTCTLSL
ncbi:MAG TPA: hypothetical protein VK034_06630 [Enhygromyxa sp.]|nr:hypothetical protein [Enhygromyxa sp.]